MRRRIGATRWRANQSPTQIAKRAAERNVYLEINASPERLDIHAPLIRLAKSQRVMAIAEMSDGSLWSATVQVEVTITACGD